MKVIRGIAIPNSLPESCVSPFSPLSCYVMRQLNTNLQASVLVTELPKRCVKINGSDIRKSKNQMVFMFTINTASHISEDQRLTPLFSFIYVREN